MSTYTGELRVEDAKWFLRAERMIVGETELSFDLFYRYKRPKKEHPLSGVAELRPEGYYQSAAKRLPDGESDVTIYILKAQPSDNNCYVEGFWYESGTGAWRISGVLEAVGT